MNQYNEQNIIMNLGSGPTHYMNRNDLINVDIFAFDEVDLVADATDLPVEDESADLIINCAMLEHVGKPETIVREMRRIAKQGAQFICYLPFIVPFHAAPDDFHRWTISGARTLFEAEFVEVEVIVGAGPTSGLLWVLLEWLSTLLSFGSKTLHDIILLALMVFTSPIKLLDLLMVKLPYAENVASGFCVIGRKGPLR
ncbi:MAG: methyltransferase domain-containing protein [Thermodesulfobacteriota bacterium]|nr:methyltransferase domain-containing protein [Thermodesulfobacteriota bacterium]